MIKLRLITFSSLILMLLTSSIYLLVLGMNLGLYGQPAEKENMFFCGTAYLPSVKAFTFDHPGNQLVKNNCSICHSIVKDEWIIGPSLYGVSEKDSVLNLDVLLYEDPKNELLNSKYFTRLKVENMEFTHTRMKFDFFSKKERQLLLTYLDTLTFLQR